MNYWGKSEFIKLRSWAQGSALFSPHNQILPGSTQTQIQPNLIAIAKFPMGETTKPPQLTRNNKTLLDNSMTTSRLIKDFSRTSSRLPYDNFRQMQTLLKRLTLR